MKTDKIGILPSYYEYIEYLSKMLLQDNEKILQDISRDNYKDIINNSKVIRDLLENYIYKYIFNNNNYYLGIEFIDENKEKNDLKSDTYILELSQKLIKNYFSKNSKVEKEILDIISTLNNEINRLSNILSANNKVLMEIYDRKLVLSRDKNKYQLLLKVLYSSDLSDIDIVRKNLSDMILRIITMLSIKISSDLPKSEEIYNSIVISSLSNLLSSEYWTDQSFSVKEELLENVKLILKDCSTKNIKDDSNLKPYMLLPEFWPTIDNSESEKSIVKKIEKNNFNN